MGEQDKRVTILTKEGGKLQAIAKGAKSSRGKLSGSTQLFYYGDFLLDKGRTFIIFEKCRYWRAFILYVRIF
ncbi:MAG: DNA repair protein RecO [Clostridia bacterium]